MAKLQKPRKGEESTQKRTKNVTQSKPKRLNGSKCQQIGPNLRLQAQP
jgi:hypothetical protein